jgi:signal transduction histidine kinase
VVDSEPGDDFLIVTPIYDLDQAKPMVLGAVIMRYDASINRGGITSYIVNVVGRSAIVFIIGAAILAAVFGALTAGGIIKRLRRLSAATYSWSRGDFSGLVADSSGDELSVLTDRMNIMAVQLQELLERRQEMAVADERNRLARELHDSAKQQAFAASAQLGAALALYEQDPAEARVHILEAERLIGQVRSELTDLILELRPAELQSAGLQGALEAYAQSWAQRNDIDVDFQVRGKGILSPESERTLFRITQEALANTARHGRAGHVKLYLNYESDGVMLTITDDGRGFDPTVPSPGLWLRSMRERTQLVGGEFAVDSAPGKGCTMVVSCPAGTSLVSNSRQKDE